MKYFIAIMIFLAITGGITGYTLRKIKDEVKESRVREDLLMQEMKLLDYQINVLTTKTMGE